MKEIHRTEKLKSSLIHDYDDDDDEKAMGLEKKTHHQSLAIRAHEKKKSGGDRDFPWPKVEKEKRRGKIAIRHRKILLSTMLCFLSWTSTEIVDTIVLFALD